MPVRRRRASLAPLSRGGNLVPSSDSDSGGFEDVAPADLFHDFPVTTRETAGTIITSDIQSNATTSDDLLAASGAASGADNTATVPASSPLPHPRPLDEPSRRGSTGEQGPDAPRATSALPRTAAAPRETASGNTGVNIARHGQPPQPLAEEIFPSGSAPATATGAAAAGTNRDSVGARQRRSDRVRAAFEHHQLVVARDRLLQEQRLLQQQQQQQQQQPGDGGPPIPPPPPLPPARAVPIPQGDLSTGSNEAARVSSGGMSAIQTNAVRGGGSVRTAGNFRRRRIGVAVPATATRTTATAAAAAASAAAAPSREMAAVAASSASPSMPPSPSPSLSVASDPNQSPGARASSVASSVRHRHVRPSLLSRLGVRAPVPETHAQVPPPIAGPLTPALSRPRRRGVASVQHPNPVATGAGRGLMSRPMGAPTRIAGGGGVAASTAAGGEGAGGSDNAAGETGAGAGAGAGAGRVAIATSIHQLHKASVVGDLTAISRFIKDGGNLEAQSFCGRTALHYAAFYGHADVARALILAGANVCSRGGGNSTPLHFAAWGGNKRVVRLLLDYGADVEARDTEGNAPQAYSEDDELYAMLARARRRVFPMPTTALSDAMETRPVAALASYAAALFLIVYAAAALVIAWANRVEVASDTSSGAGSNAGEVNSAAVKFSIGVGGRMAAAVAAAMSAASKEDISGIGGGGGGVSSTVFLIALPAALLAGLAPALAFAIGYNRRTDSYWQSVKDRDAEIVRLRHREQASGGWPPVLQSGAAAVAGAAPLGPAAGSISRGEQAGQQVLARLSRLQAAAVGATGTGAGLVVPPGAVPLAAGDGGRVDHHNAQQLQEQMLRYQRAVMATGGSGTGAGRVVEASGGAQHAGGGGGGGGGGRRCVQVAQ